MSDADPTHLNLAEDWNETLEERTMRDRVYEVACTLTAPTTVSDISDRADCTEKDARYHLDWFVNLGILNTVTNNPDLFVRNEAYFRFRRVTELVRTLNTTENIKEEIRECRARDRELSASFDASSPDDVVVEDGDGGVQEAETRVSEWRAIKKRLRELKMADRQLE